MDGQFTPRDYVTGERLSFPMAEIRVLSGDLLRRGRGVKAVVEIAGQRYRVIGAACGAPGCMCDSTLKPCR